MVGPAAVFFTGSCQAVGRSTRKSNLIRRPTDLFRPPFHMPVTILLRALFMMARKGENK